MSWIKVIPYGKAKGELKTLYDRVRSRNGQIDNILKIHSLRPHSLTGHMYLYKNVLHHRNNTLEKWYLEAVGVYVSLLNRCEYCIDHHLEGLRKLRSNSSEAEKIKEVLISEQFSDVFTEKEANGLMYARKLTNTPDKIIESDIRNLINSGFDEGQILELNQVVSYFSYANRTVLGLGVTTENEILGLSPGNTDQTEDWQHN